ncbi:MAG: hypothetical protein WCF44_00395 [Candidatus Methylophosphatis roskildensis]|uniref:Transmembrane protein n=1 Tax=Candidatus Methylophosphatis roskildensis TaxID=2899263 RepID=A0A9D7E2Q4_9PROT|nr:hypothetical protein [Candidatus Methylophosphatis roskildensis]MBK7235579.1 hypothetical protein [Sterolibacteriaceae bacterium]
MSAFNRLPGFVETPPGLERRVLRLLPKVLILGSLLLVAPWLMGRVVSMSDPESATVSQLSTVGIYCISLLLLHWTAVLTGAIAAFIVMVMKGPAYVADAYSLDEVDTPVSAKRPPIQWRSRKP